MATKKPFRGSPDSKIVAVWSFLSYAHTDKPSPRSGGSIVGTAFTPEELAKLVDGFHKQGGHLAYFDVRGNNLSGYENAMESLKRG